MVYLFVQIVYKPSEEIRRLQKKMASLFEKQRRKGGVIDIEQERNRFLIDITSVWLETFNKTDVHSIKCLKNNLYCAQERTAPIHRTEKDGDW